MLPSLTALHLPRTLFGAGSLASLADELIALGVRRPMLVTDKGLVKAGLVEKLVAACRGTVALTVFDGVTENPLFSDVDSGAQQYVRDACDGVIALGGGSVIDTSKFIALLATNAGVAADFAGVPGVKHGPSAPLIVIPTTAGTGSEASPSAGIHPNAHTATLGMSSRHLVPKVAILDPDLTASLPQRLTAATGIDALSHCIEGYLSKRDLPLGKSIALDGIARVARSLRGATAHRDLSGPGRYDARGLCRRRIDRHGPGACACLRHHVQRPGISPRHLERDRHGRDIECDCLPRAGPRRRDRCGVWRQGATRAMRLLR